MIENNIIEYLLALNFTLFIILRKCPFILPEKIMKVLEKTVKVKVTLGEFLFKKQNEVLFSLENGILFV